MIDLKAARNDPDGYRAALARKGASAIFDELDVVLSVAEGDRPLLGEAHVLGEEIESRALGDAGLRELEEVRQRLRDV